MLHAILVQQALCCQTDLSRGQLPEKKYASIVPVILTSEGWTKFVTPTITHPLVWRDAI